MFLVHGIGQGSAAMQFLYGNLTGTQGLDPTKFQVDYGFDFSDCAANTSCAATCSLASGGQRLGQYIQAANAPGRIILLGYSMGGLMSRDVIANNYGNLRSSGKIAALITLGSPNLGYPYVALDNLAFCAQLVNDMAGGWYPLTPQPPTVEYLSTYLSGLQQSWQSASYAGPWLAGAGQQCGNGIRNFNFLTQNQTIGCPTTNGRGDGVVCLASASYSGAFATGPTPLANTWQDTGQIYVHTNSYAGWGSAGVFCGNSGNPVTNPPMFNPPPIGPRSLFNQVEAIINGTNNN